MSQLWTEAEILLVRSLRQQGMTIAEIAKFIPNRTARGVRNVVERYMERMPMPRAAGSGRVRTKPQVVDTRNHEEASNRNATIRLGKALAKTGMRYAEAERPADDLSPFERQMRALERGARLVANDARHFGFPVVYRGEAA